jgi:hypothetical protein
MRCLHGSLTLQRSPRLKGCAVLHTFCRNDEFDMSSRSLGVTFIRAQGVRILLFKEGSF